MKTNKKTKNKKKVSTRGESMFAASLGSLILVSIGIYGYLNKSFTKSQVDVVLTDAQALGVLVFCCVVSIVILLYTWFTSKLKKAANATF